MNNNYSPQLNTAINAAIQAGKIIMRFYSRLENLKVMSKGHNDYVSEADQQAESIIKETLIKSYPTYKITAEESGSNDIESEYEWFVDPLDGTTNFIHGIQQFAVSIGLCKEGKLTFFTQTNRNRELLDAMYEISCSVQWVYKPLIFRFNVI